MSWIEVKSTFAPGIDLSPFVEIYDAYGIDNTLEEGDCLTGCLVEVDGSVGRIAELTQALTDAGAIEVISRDLVEDNWEIAWRQFFKPRRIGKRFVVRPTWEEFQSGPEDRVIVLDPGQAFGTGDHPTTRLCLELMEGLPIKGRRVIDIGCGSGILSIGACLMNAKKVLAIDIDPIAVEVAKENRDLNGVEFEAYAGEGLDGLKGDWDVAISNIISATLVRIAGDVRDVLVDSGHWIVSGIILDNWPDVKLAAEKAGFEFTGLREEDGWVAASFKCRC